MNGIVTLKPPKMEPILLGEEPFTWPQLLIYSKTDELVRREVSSCYMLNLVPITTSPQSTEILQGFNFIVYQ